MADDKRAEGDILISLYIENREQFRHHEEQRANVANISITVAGGILAYLLIESDAVSASTQRLLSVLSFVAAIYGWLMSEKLSERSSLHLIRSRMFLDKLDEMFPQLAISADSRKLKRRHVWSRVPISLLSVHLLWRIMFFLLALVAAAILLGYAPF